MSLPTLLAPPRPTTTASKVPKRWGLYWVAPPPQAANRFLCQGLRENAGVGILLGRRSTCLTLVGQGRGPDYRQPAALQVPATLYSTRPRLSDGAPWLPPARPHRKTCSANDGAPTTPCRVALSAKSRPCGASARVARCRLASGRSGARLRPTPSWGLYRRWRGLCRGGSSLNQRVAGIIPGGTAGQTSSRFSNSLPSSCPR
jgi:hypothetical protein